MLASSRYVFPDPIQADPDEQGLICIGADLSPETLYQAYRQGLFPWFSEGEPICWWSQNLVVLFDQIHLSQANRLSVI